ncbi:MAG: PAS domain S-box protein, partial [Anaerolineae bacterium]|nr:PAS domain S-box protein [Anaerolineae bacterium]
IEHTPDLISRLDRELRYVYINPIVEKITGIPAHHYIGKTDDELYTNTDLIDSWQSALRHVFETGQEYTLEYSYKNSQTGDKWYQSRIVPEFTPDGTISTVLSISRDVSRSKLAELELEATNARLHLLNRIISVASTTLNVNLVLEEICREFAQFLNVPYAAAALLEGQKASFVASYGMEESQQSITLDSAVYDTLMHHHKPLVMEDIQQHFHLHPDTASLMIVPIFVRGHLTGIIHLETPHQRHFTEEETTLILMAAQAVSQAVENCLLHQNIADHNARLAEQVERRTAQYQRLNERMSAILNSVNDAILLIQSDGTIDITNPTFECEFGYQPDELFGIGIDSIAIDAHKPRLMQVIRRVMQDGEPQRIEFTACRKNGEFFDADMAVALVRNHEASLVCSIRDITYSKEVDRMKDNFISMVSHELRTPISVMTLITGGMRKYYERMTDEQRLKKLEQIETQSGVLAELVESVLDISRMDARQKQ